MKYNCNYKRNHGEVAWKELAPEIQGWQTLFIGGAATPPRKIRLCLESDLTGAIRCLDRGWAEFRPSLSQCPTCISRQAGAGEEPKEQPEHKGCQHQLLPASPPSSSSSPLPPPGWGLWVALASPAIPTIASMPKRYLGDHPPPAPWAPRCLYLYSGEDSDSGLGGRWSGRQLRKAQKVLSAPFLTTIEGSVRQTS